MRAAKWSIVFGLLFSFSLEANAFFNEVFADLLGVRPPRNNTRVSYDYSHYESAGVKGAGSKVKLRQHHIDSSIPLSTKEDQKWRGYLYGGWDDIHNSARFPNGRVLPQTVRDAGIGFSYVKKMSEERNIGGTLALESPSDKPFGQFRDTGFNTSLFYKVPGKDESAWIFLVSLSNVRGFANYIPLPGFAYYFKARENLRFALGVPFLFAFWTPIEKLVITTSYFPLYNAQFRASYFLFGPAQIYGQARFQSKNYFLSERQNRKERLFMEEGIALAGVTLPIARSIPFLVDLSYGYSFDRRFFLGERSSDRKDGQIIRIDNGNFASLRVIGSF